MAPLTVSRGVRAERKLILWSAGTASRRQSTREQVASLCGQVHWERLATVLQMRKLLAVLGPRIAELAGASVEEDFLATVERVQEAGRRQGTFLQLTGARLVGMLADAGIRSSALKGPFLSESIYGDPGRRMSDDIDLLVAPEQLRAAVDVVRTLGYGEPEDHVQENGLPLLHLVLAHESGELPPVELHWRIHWYESRFAQERLLPPAGELAQEWRPASADELAALLLFYARDGFIDLRLAADIGAWWDAYGAELSAGGCEETMRSYPSLARVIAAAAQAAERVVGLPAENVLGGAARAGFRGRVAARLANPNPRSSTAQLYADMGLIDGLLAPPKGLAEFARRQLLPPSDVRDAQARHGARQRSRSRWGRCFGVLGRYGLRMTGLAGLSEAMR